MGMFMSNHENNGNIVMGLKRGIVKDLKDPDKLNRIQVSLIDEELDLPFADIMVKSANKESEHIFVPSVNDEVIVGFIDGKINDPIILGSVFNSKTQPSIKIDAATNEIIFISFPMGLSINMNSKDNSQNLTIKTKKGHIVSLDDGSNEVLEIKNKSGDTSFKIDFKGGEITVAAKNKITFSAGQDSLTIEANKGVNVASSGGKLQANVNEIALTAKSNCNIKANAQFVAQGSSTAEIKSSGQAAIKGSMTKVG